MSYGKPSRARQFFGDLSAFERQSAATNETDIAVVPLPMSLHSVPS